MIFVDIKHALRMTKLNKFTTFHKKTNMKVPSHKLFEFIVQQLGQKYIEVQLPKLVHVNIYVIVEDVKITVNILRPV